MRSVEEQPITGARPATNDEEGFRVHTGDSGRSELDVRVAEFKFALAVREAQFKRREEALKRAERALALPRVSAQYFEPGNNLDEDGWWSKQLGRR